jgi:predicted alpha/beta-fold hydrolase
VSAVASVCAPLDLAAGGEAIGRGFNKLVYTTHVPATA